MSHDFAGRTAACAEFDAVLPVLDSPAPDAATRALHRRAHEHLRTCAHCRALRADYEALDAALIRHLSAASIAARPTWAITEGIMRSHPDHSDAPPTTPTPVPEAPRATSAPLRRHRLVQSIAAVAAVLVLAALTLSIFAMRRGSGWGSDGVGTLRYTFANTHGLFAAVSMVSPDEGWALASIRPDATANASGLGSTSAGTGTSSPRSTTGEAQPNATATITATPFLPGSALTPVQGQPAPTAVPGQGQAAPTATVNPAQSPAAPSASSQGGVRTADGEVVFYHYSNGRWTPTPAHGTTSLTEGGPGGFNGEIVMRSATEGWAIARNYNRAAALFRLSNGTWNEQPLPARAHDLTDLQVTSSGGVWAVIPSGESAAGGGIAHFDGARWTTTPLQGFITALAMLSDEQGFALSVASSSTGQAKLLRYSSGAWSEASTLDAKGQVRDEAAMFGRLAMISPDEGWVLGEQTVSVGGKTANVPMKQLVFHYKNGTWTQESISMDKDIFVTLSHLSMRGPSDGWIFGSEQTTRPGTTASGVRRRAVAYHYDGSGWQRVAFPGTGTTVNDVTGASFAGDTGWATGYLSDIPTDHTVQDSDIAHAGSPVLWRYANGAWTQYQQ